MALLTALRLVVRFVSSEVKAWVNCVTVIYRLSVVANDWACGLVVVIADPA